MDNPDISGYYDTPGVSFKGISDILDEQATKEKSALEDEQTKQSQFDSTLEGHIISIYHRNRRAREESDIEQEMIKSLYQANSKYTTEELSEIYGSNIFMGLTAIKQRMAASWINDLVRPSTGFPLSCRPSNIPEVPEEIREKIKQAFEQDKQRIIQEIQSKYIEQPEQPPQPQQEGQEQQQQPPEKEQSALVASRQLREISELKRDIDEAIREEIDKIALTDCKLIEDAVIDDLLQGDWDKEFRDFIDSFTIFPTAYFKGPIVTTRKKLKWIGGVAQEEIYVCYKNQNVNPLDIYPSPSARTIYDGDFIEHLRLTKKDLSDLANLDEDTGYRAKNIISILEESPSGSYNWINTNIEEAKVQAEDRGSQTHASVGIYHGIHFWGTASVKMLKEWGSTEVDLPDLPDWKEVEIEAVLVADKVIKCLINKDPQGRRPYYSASFRSKPGSIWGDSLPFLMRPEQRMCNASVRSLADNMGLSSGPACAILVDRLADDGEITEQEPFKIWQFESDPQGSGGKPIEYFDIPSHANELLAVYDKFELKADDSTGVPRYAYGNDQTGGAAQTAKGMAMLLEGASKGIKHSIDNISLGLLKPRAEYQFYLHLLQREEEGNPLPYTGDINIVVHAADALTLKAAELELQKELLEITASNPNVAGIVGEVGLADMLRVVYKGANFGETIVPTRLEVKDKAKDAEQQRAQAAQAEAQAQQQKTQVSLEATKLQVDGQKEMHQGTQAVKREDSATKAKLKQVDQQLEAQRIDKDERIAVNKNLAETQRHERRVSSGEQTDDRKLAIELRKQSKEVTVSDQAGEGA